MKSLSNNLNISSNNGSVYIDSASNISIGITSSNKIIIGSENIKMESNNVNLIGNNINFNGYEKLIISTEGGNIYFKGLFNLYNTTEQIYHDKDSISNLLSGYSNYIGDLDLPYINSSLSNAYWYNLEKLSNSQKGELISKRDCWERIKTYCCNNHLFYRNYGTGIYLPDKKLIELLELSPTTRISSDNIQKLLKPHYNNINKENMSYLIEYSHRMNIIESNQERCLNTYKDKNFICGFFSTKKKYPNDFILLQEFRAGESDPYPQKYILKT